MQHEHLALYENMAAISGAMADAARSSNWERLIELEQTCARQMDCIKQIPAPELSQAERERKIGLIRTILEHDREIRDYTMPWMKHLAALIGSVRNERKLVTAYGA